MGNNTAHGKENIKIKGLIVKALKSLALPVSPFNIAYNIPPVPTDTGDLFKVASDIHSRC